MSGLGVPSVADVCVVLGRHDPARTMVQVEGDWIRVDLGRPADGVAAAGVGQTVYLYRLGERSALTGERRPKSLGELLADLSALLAEEFRPAATARPGRRARAG